MRPFLSLSFALAATAAMAPFAWAHFRLLEPASWIEENNLGDPQKLGPCGGTSANQAKGKAANPGTPTNMVTKAQGGQKLHIKLQETVFHPGHYRIALAVNSRAELPAGSGSDHCATATKAPSRFQRLSTSRRSLRC